MTLIPSATNHDYRLARKAVIEAIAALSDSAGRMSVEPVAARKGLEEMAALLIAAHGLIAQLSAARLDARSGGPAPDEATRAWLHARLASKTGDANAQAPALPGPLAAAALAVVEAAQRYQRAAEIVGGRHLGSHSVTVLGRYVSDQGICRPGSGQIRPHVWALCAARMGRGGLPTSSQGHCGAVTPQGGGAVPWIGV